jgi:FMN reductase
MRFVTLVGNPKAGSRTATVAEAATRAVVAAAAVPATRETVDLSGLACRLLLPQASAVIEDAVDEVLGADVLLVASPTFKGTYTGLLKVFLDRLGYHALGSTLALPILVMKHPEHTLAVEVHLRPLLVELGATVPTPGLAVMESDLGRLDHVLAPWARRMATQVTAKAAALAAVPAGPADPAGPLRGGAPRAASGGVPGPAAPGPPVPVAPAPIAPVTPATVIPA